MTTQVAFHRVYRSLLIELLGSAAEVNERTGVRVKVIFGGTSFSLDLRDRVMPTCGLRRTWPRVAAAETAWYVSGEQDVTWMRKHAPIWDKFVEEIPLGLDLSLFDPLVPMPASLRFRTKDVRMTDGSTQRVQDGPEFFDGVSAAYGYRWRRHFGRDQLRLAVDALRANPTDRRVVVSAWDPAEDGLGAEGQKNVPCPAMFTLSISEGHLHSTMLLRSSDVFVGLPYDVLGHALLMDAVAAELGVPLGTAQFTLAHAHLYESHWEMAREAVRQLPVVPDQSLPGWTLRAIETHRDMYVEAVRRDSSAHEWPTYRPSPEVVA